jgi:hypothetical protein
MKWLRFYTEILDDPKMRELDHLEYRLFTYMLAVAAECERDGLIPMMPNVLAWRVRYPLADVERTIHKLKALNVIRQNGIGIEFINWGKRQYQSDNVNERVRRHRAKQSQDNETLHETLQEPLHETLHETDQSRAEQNRAEQNNTIPKGMVVSSRTEDERGSSRENPSPEVRECPHKAIIELYHMYLPECAKVKVWTEERQSNLRTRWREDPKRQSLEWWSQYFLNVRLCFWFSDGHKGDWKPDLEWLVKKANLVKVIEGRYLATEEATETGRDR